MAHLEKGSVAQQIGTLFEGGSVAGLSDRQLLERFNSRRDAAGEAAFAALVARHGPMVLGVCRQLLDDRHLAEDAFQATFLVLARKARSIRDSDRLGNWLYGVAFRTARCARLRLARRREREEIGTMIRSGSNAPVEPTVPPAEEAIMAREQAEALHGEIARLPDAFRLPVVLCYLEGLTVHEAARQLRWSHGTVRSRMARAREKLRRGLTRRGIVLPAAALAAVLDSRPASASVSSPLYEITTRAALRFAAGPAAVDALSASTTALAQEVLRSMLIHKLKLVALTVLFLGAVATGAGYLTRSLAMKDEPVKTPAGQQSRPAAGSDRPDRGPVPSPGRMFVTGRCARPGRQAGGRRAGRHHRAAPRAVGCHARVRRSARSRWPRRDGRRRPLSYRCRCALRRTASSKSTPWPRRPASAWAGSHSTPMPSSPRLRSGSAPSRSSVASCSMCTVNRPLESSSRFGAWAAPTCPKPREGTTASAWAIPRRRRDSASGRGPSRPTTRADSRSPASVAMSPSASTSETDDSRAQGFRSAPTTAMVRKPSRKLSGPR